MVKSLDKGKRFERQVAKLLTKATGVEWHRVPQSGATATNFRLKGLRGDVFTEDDSYKNLTIECKSYKHTIDLKDIFNDKSVFWKWVMQTYKEAKEGGEWMLFFRDQRYIWVAMPQDAFYNYHSIVANLVDGEKGMQIGAFVRSKGKVYPFNINIYKVKKLGDKSGKR